MSNGNFTATQANTWIATAGTWVALHTDHPEQAGAYLSEYSGEGYGRVQGTFGAVSNRTVWVTSALAWTGLAAGTIAYLGGWDAETSGNLSWWVQLPSPKLIVDGQGFSVAANTIALSL